MAREVGVPRVRVHQVRTFARSCNLKIDAEGTQRCVRPIQLRQIRMAGDPRVCTLGPRGAGAVKRLHSQVIDESAQHLSQFENMDTRSAVHVRRVFAGK